MHHQNYNNCELSNQSGLTLLWHERIVTNTSVSVIPCAVAHMKWERSARQLPSAGLLFSLCHLFSLCILVHQGQGRELRSVYKKKVARYIFWRQTRQDNERRCTSREVQNPFVACLVLSK
jgi:hypothetical protein